MENIWNNQELADDELGKAIYLSKILSQEKILINNIFAEISFKKIDKNIFDEELEYLNITKKGVDFKFLDENSFVSLEKERLDKLITLENLNDTMIKEFIKDGTVDTLVHSIIPFKYVLFTTPEPLLAISNSKKSQEIMTKLFADKILFIPYIKPGAIFAKSLNDIFKQIDWTEYNGIFVQHYGLFTFNEDIKTCYDNLVIDINKAIDYLQANSIVVCGDEIRESKSPFSFITNIFKKACTCLFGGKKDKNEKMEVNLLTLAKIRNKVSKSAAKSLFVKYYDSKRAIHFSSIENADEFTNYPPIIPHIIDKTKLFPALFANKFDNEINLFKTKYQNYFDEFKSESMNLGNVYPSWAIWQNMGALLISNNKKEIDKLADIVESSISIKLKYDLMGGYESATNEELFDIEFNTDRTVAISEKFAGKVVMVNGALNESLKPLIEELLAKGAVVLGVDIKTSTTKVFNHEQYFGINIDLQNIESFKSRVKEVLLEFGGIDIFISNIGQNISLNAEKIESNNWQKYIDNNITLHKAIISAYKDIINESIEPRVLILGLNGLANLPKEHTILNDMFKEQELFFNNCVKELENSNIKVDFISSNTNDASRLKEIVVDTLSSSFYSAKPLVIKI